MIFEVKCDERTNERTKNERTDRTHTRIVSFIVLDCHLVLGFVFILVLDIQWAESSLKLEHNHILHKSLLHSSKTISILYCCC